MMAVDTSALMAILLDEVQASACIDALASESELLISAATVAEALVVADRRGICPAMTGLLDDLGFEVIAVTAAVSRRIVEIYRRWGKGQHAAGLNFGDCFSYDVASTYTCPLLFVGEDFSKTDVRSALPPRSGSR